MQTDAQFMAAINATNTHYSANSSSLTPVVAALAQYNAGAANDSGNLWTLFLAIAAIPEGKKQKYSNALYGLVNVVYFYPPNLLTLNNVANGIAITRHNGRGSHIADAVLALMQLDACPVGHNFLTEICTSIQTTGQRVAIKGWDAQQTNKCAVVGGMGDHAKSRIALDIEFNQAMAGATINACMVAAGQGGNYAWLSTSIDNLPIYDIIGIPSIVQSQTTNGAGWVSAAMIQDWVNGITVFPAPLGNLQAKNAAKCLATVLYPYTATGAGMHSVVMWDPTSTTFTDTTGTVQQKTPYISLAHEMIHAYHNINGKQSGHEIGTYSRVLFEYLCMGLGAWTLEPYSENTIRASANIPLRVCY